MGTTLKSYAEFCTYRVDLDLVDLAVRRCLEAVRLVRVGDPFSWFEAELMRMAEPDGDDAARLAYWACHRIPSGVGLGLAHRAYDWERSRATVAVLLRLRRRRLRVHP